MAIGHAAFNELLSTTIQNIETDLVDQVLSAHPGLDVLKKNAESGEGPAVVINLIGGENAGTTISDDSGTFSTAVDNDVVGVAKYDWSAPIVTPTRVKWKQLEMNAGPSGVTKLVKAHITAATNGHGKKLAQLLHHTGAPASGAFFSLDNLVGDADSDTAAGITVGGINSSTATYWQAVRNTIPASGEGSMDVKSAIRKTATDLFVASNGGRATVILAGRDIYDEYEASLDEQVRYNSLAVGDIKFQSLRFDGIEVRLDPDCPADRMYFIDEGSLEFSYLNGSFMKAQEAQKITGTLDTVTPLVTVATLGVNARRANALLIRA